RRSCTGGNAMNPRATFGLLSAALAALLVTAAAASAQTYPTQRITVVVPFGAGSVTDILARIFAEEMRKRWDQQVVVENRPGLASTTFIAGALFRKAAGVDLVHVPYKSAPDAVTAVVRGDADMYFAPVNLSKEMAEAGKVVAIAAATAQRLPEMQHVPTFTEEGLLFVYDSWFGLLAPAGVPRPVLDKISKEWAAALKTQEMQASLKSKLVLGVSDTPEA